MPRFQARVLKTASGLDPAHALCALSPDEGVVLLDSSNAQGWSLLAWNPDRIINGKLQGGLEDSEGNSSSAKWPKANVDPAQELELACQGEEWEDPPLPLAKEAWVGGWIGWFGFECGHAWESWPWVCNQDDFPDYHFARYRQGIAFDPEGNHYLVFCEELDGDANSQQLQCEELINNYKQILQNVPNIGIDPCGELQWKSQSSPEQFKAGVTQLRHWIGDGELFQANLSHTLQSKSPSSASNFYRAVRASQETSMSAFWRGLNSQAVLSWSPELFLHVDGRTLKTRPIKGTIARGGSKVQDELAKRQLNEDKKELAELTMIVDMARNDLGRVAKHGKVKVLSAGEVETWPTLHHRTATIEAEWDPRSGIAALLAATFPPASVTGAPKVRALQAIAELEQSRRGPYCGCFGVWQPGRNRGDFSVLIRTAVVDGGAIKLRVGAGIVWDSDPELEWEETLLKARYLQQ